MRASEYTGRRLRLVVLWGLFLLLPTPYGHAVGTGALAWPAPPQEPRIRYERSIATPEDVEPEPGFFGRIWDFFRGPENTEMVKPMAVAVDGRGIVYVADPGAKSVHAFDVPGGGYRRLQAHGDTELMMPIGLAVGDDDRLYVADGRLGRVLVYDAEGEPAGSFGGGNGLKRPTGIAVDADAGRLYVVDTPAHTIRRYDLESGEALAPLGSRGDRPGRFNYPSFVAVDDDGRMYVTDSLNARIQVLDRGGDVVGIVGQFGDGTGDFSAPKGIAVDRDGHVYVADAAFDNVQIFSRDGELLLYWGETGQDPGRFWMPAGLFMDERDRLYVVDTYNKRIQVFQYLR